MSHFDGKSYRDAELKVDPLLKMALDLNIPYALYQVNYFYSLLSSPPRRCSYPFIFYLIMQSANIVPDVYSGCIRADTTIWLGFKNTVVIGDKINLHCRQCEINEVNCGECYLVCINAGVFINPFSCRFM